MLGDREREVVVLTYWEGLTAEESATVLGSTPGAVWATLTRARAKLRAAIGQHLAAQTTAASRFAPWARLTRRKSSHD